MGILIFCTTRLITLIVLLLLLCSYSVRLHKLPAFSAHVLLFDVPALSAVAMMSLVQAAAMSLVQQTSTGLLGRSASQISGSLAQ